MTAVTEDAIDAAMRAVMARHGQLEAHDAGTVIPYEMTEFRAEVVAALEAAAPLIVSHRETATAAAIARAERERIRHELAGDQLADHAPIESIYGLTCRTCVSWQDAPLADGGETEFGIAIPEQWPCHVARALADSTEG